MRGCIAGTPCDRFCQDTFVPRERGLFRVYVFQVFFDDRRDLSFREWATVISYSKMTTARRDRLTHRCQIVKNGNDSLRFKASSAAARKEE
tara:strand:+ start:69 stop:341 length:273 start_codon:yes stop_codon:yes gene_type:complete